MTLTINRRRFITAASTLTAAGGAVAGAAVAHAHQSEILVLSARYWDLVDQAMGATYLGLPYEDAWALCDLRNSQSIDTGELIATLQAKTPNELAAKIEVMREMAGYPMDRPEHLSDPTCDRIAQRGLWMAIRDARRMGGSS